MHFSYRQAIVLFIAGMVVVMLGLLFKIQHWPHGSVAIGAGLFAQMSAVLLLVVLLMKRK